MNSNLPFKRIVAYIIDFFVITIISSALTYFTFLNPKYDEYKKVSLEYSNIVDAYYKGNDTTLLQDKTKELKEDINNYKENNHEEDVESLKELIDYLDNYDFSKLEIGELKAKIEEYDFNDSKLKEKAEEYITYLDTYQSNNITISDMQNRIQDLSYDLLKTGYVYVIGDIVIAILYFGVFNYITKGQTLGKKLMRIKIVSKDNGDVLFYQYLIRAIILNGIILNVISLIAVCFNKETFTTIYKYGSNFDTILMLTNFLMIMFMKNGRGLHDILAGTKVVDLKEIDTNSVASSDDNAKPEVIKPKKTTAKKTSKKDLK